MPPAPGGGAPPLGAPADNAQFLRKQRAAIEVIAADNMKLKEELMLENKFSVNPTTTTAAALIANLQGQADVYAAKITEEQRSRAEQEAQVEGLRRHIAEQRVAMGGINASAEQAVKAQRRVRILEDRLQKASVRYNEQLGRNRALRDRIDSLRRERMLFEELGGKLGRGLERQKAAMLEVIGRIAEAHEAREKAAIMQGQVKAQADRDVAAYEAEWRQLTGIVEADRAAREAQRAREIAAREQQMAALFRQEFGGSGGSRASSPPGTAAAKGRPASKGGRGSEGGKGGAEGAAATAPERVRQLKEELAKVLAATGAADVEELQEQLAAGQEASFRLFGYVNDLSSEVDRLEEGIAALRRARKEVERYRAETEAAANDDRAQQLRALSAELAAAEDEAEEYEAKHAQAAAMLESLRAAVLNMFNRCGCATPAVLELLGGEGEGVSERNLMQYLGVVEQRTNELLAEFCLLAADGAPDAAGERAAAVLTGGSGAAAAQAPLRFVIEPPSAAAGGAAAGAGAGAGGALPALPHSSGSLRAEDEEGMPEGGPAVALDGDRPLSRGSLQARAARAVAARGEAAVKIKAVRVPHASSTGATQQRRQ